MAGGIFESLRTGVRSDEEIALNFMFPARNKYEMLQMLTETQPRAVTPFAVLDVFRKKYKSKILKSFAESHHTIKVGQERKGRLEGSEIVVGMRKAAKGDGDDE